MRARARGITVSELADGSGLDDVSRLPASEPGSDAMVSIQQLVFAPTGNNECLRVLDLQLGTAKTKIPLLSTPHKVSLC